MVGGTGSVTSKQNSRQAVESAEKRIHEVPSTRDSFAVICRNVAKDFVSGDATIRVLHGIDLKLPDGELALLVGPSGCGKTTLISIIAGLLEPTEGSVEVMGQPFSAMKGGQKVSFRGRNIGFVFQQYNLLPSLTAAE